MPDIILGMCANTNSNSECINVFFARRLCFPKNSAILSLLGYNVGGKLKKCAQKSYCFCFRLRFDIVRLRIYPLRAANSLFLINVDRKNNKKQKNSLFSALKEKQHNMVVLVHRIYSKSECREMQSFGRFI